MKLDIQKRWHQAIHHCRQNIKLFYYLKSALRQLPPRTLLCMLRPSLLARYEHLSEDEKRYVDDRVDYYCKHQQSITLPDDALRLGDFNRSSKLIYRVDDGKRVKTNSVYYYDAYEYARYFPADLRWVYNPGDVNYLFPIPEITKSRPILADGGNANNILLNLDKVRHFVFVDDPFSWDEKKAKALFRGACYAKPKREAFIRQFIHHPLLDIRDTSRNSNFPAEWCQQKPMDLYDHLKYRYIISLEGNDVASNLKWIMSSNSAVVMPKPTCETWFMEGRLVPGYHFIEIQPDFCDLADRIAYYEAHPEEAKAIVAHAHEWVAQFWNKDREKLISLMVLNRYFTLTGQLPTTV